MSANTALPSWNPGPVREKLLAFLDAAQSVPVSSRVAYFNNDGTLWCERPTYVQFDFFVAGLRRRVEADASLSEQPEFKAILDGDRAAMAGLGLPRIAMALAGLFAGQNPEEFAAEVREFMSDARHPTLQRPLTTITYQPMLELLDELRRHQFTVGIVTGGGTEFVRAMSHDLYQVPPELVVGTLIAYEFSRDESGLPTLRRADRLLGDADEGAAKVTNIQTQLGRRPILAAGNSAGDREMLEWALAGQHPNLALLVDHDDADREFAYVSESPTVKETEPITELGTRLGWTVVSMARDWSTIFPTTTDSLTREDGQP